MKITEIGRYVVVRGLPRSAAPHAHHYWQVRYGDANGPVVCNNLRSRRGAIVVAIGREADAKRVDKQNARAARSILVHGCQADGRG